VLVVMGDAQGKRKMDAKLVGQAVDAAIEASAARIVLATPLGGGGGGGGFFGGFFGGGGGGTVAGTGDLKLSRPEQQVQCRRIQGAGPKIWFARQLSCAHGATLESNFRLSGVGGSRKRQLDSVSEHFVGLHWRGGDHVARKPTKM